MVGRHVYSIPSLDGTRAATTVSVSLLQLAHGQLTDLRDDEFPTALSAWRDGVLKLDDRGTHFGYVYSGQAVVDTPVGTFTLRAGMCFSVPGRGLIRSEGAGVVASRIGYQGMFTITGPLEPVGRLRYIDGCTDSLLLPPVTLGDPCLSALYFPRGTCQTPHTHPSLRIGIVAAGAGECVTPAASELLLPGRIFLIPPDAIHSFRTTDDPMTVVVYHPDSDFGPTDEVHPMINRTLIDGIAARNMEGLRPSR